MARINIEDSLFKDVRFTSLMISLQSRHAAIGAIVDAFIIAQDFFLIEAYNRMIPISEWKRRGALDQVIACGLAEIRGEFVYVCGSEKQFAWLIQRKNAGKSGGLSKSSNRIKRQSSLAVAKRPPSGRYPLTLPLTPTLPLSPAPAQTLAQSKELNTLPIFEKKSAPDSKNLVSVYCDLWKSKNGRSPDIRPKEAGQITKLVKDVGFDRAQKIMEVYFSMPDPYFVKRGYDVSTMISNLSAIGQFEANKKIVTSGMIRELEKRVDKAQNTKLEKTMEEIMRENQEQKRIARGE